MFGRAFENFLWRLFYKDGGENSAPKYFMFAYMYLNILWHLILHTKSSMSMERQYYRTKYIWTKFSHTSKCA